jgi:hypothetical protein
MKVKEVERIEGVRRGVIGLIRLWKCVEKPKAPGAKSTISIRMGSARKTRAVRPYGVARLDSRRKGTVRRGSLTGRDKPEGTRQKSDPPARAQKRQTQDPGSKTEPGAPSASLYFP